MKLTKRKNNLAAVIVDMQDFFLKNFSLKDKNLLIENQAIVIRYCAKNQIPIVVLEYKAGGILRGATTSVLKKLLKDSRDLTIVKENNGGFTRTALAETLSKINCHRILIMGINANGCVQDTVIGALNRKFEVMTSQGIIASSSRGNLQFSPNNRNWYQKNTEFYENINELMSALRR